MVSNNTRTLPPLDPATAAESNTETLLSVMGTFTFLALLMVSLRIYTRIRLVKSVGWDDWLMSTAMIFTLGGQACFVIMALNGMGKHAQTVSKDQSMVFRQASWFKSMIHAAGSLCFLKLSVGAHLLRLVSQSRLKWAIWGTMVFVALYTIVGWMSFLTLCVPIQFSWDKSIKGGSCYGPDIFIRFALFNTSANITTDVLFATFPIPVIWKLHMRKRIRLYLIGVLSLGYFAVAFGVMKALAQLGKLPGEGMYYDWVDLFGHLQITTGIIAACAPTLKPLVGRALRLNSSDNSSGPYKHSKSSKQRPRILGPFSIPPSVNQTDFALTRSDSFPPRQDLERGQVTSQAEYFNKSVHISYYGYPESDSGDYSERSSQHMKQHDGILCTKEIIIHR